MSKRYPFPAIIFAGGQSRRMGEDKALLPFGGESSLAAYQYAKLTPLFSEVYLSAKSDKFDFHPPMIIDRHQESSPMVGLLSIFKTLETEKVFILSVDAPMVTETVIEKLVETFEAGSADVVVAETSAGIHPLCGLYRTTTYPEIQAHYQKGEHRLKRLLEKVQTVCCFFEDEKLLSNLNHPEEYREALQQTT